MYSLLLKAIAATAVFIVIAHYTRDRAYARPVLILTIIVYLSALVYYTFIRGSRAGLSGVSFRFPLPFWRSIQDRHYGLSTNRSVLNVILFIPFGFLAPQLITLQRQNWKLRWWQILLAGFLLSLLIETTQLVFHFGVFEMDDLVKNTMGAGIGWVIWKKLNTNDG